MAISTPTTWHPNPTLPPLTLVRMYYPNGSQASLLVPTPPLDPIAPEYADEVSSNTYALANDAWTHKPYPRDPGHLPRGINIHPNKLNQFSKGVPRCVLCQSTHCQPMILCCAHPSELSFPLSSPVQCTVGLTTPREKQAQALGD